MSRSSECCQSAANSDIISDDTAGEGVWRAFAFRSPCRGSDPLKVQEFLKNETTDGKEREGTTRGEIQKRREQFLFLVSEGFSVASSTIRYRCRSESRALGGGELDVEENDELREKMLVVTAILSGLLAK